MLSQRLLIDGLLECAVFGLQGQTTCLHLYRLFRSTDLHVYVYGDAAANIENDVRLAVVLKAGCRHLHVISTDSKVGKAVETPAIRGCRMCYVGRCIDDRDRCTWNDSSCGICDNALDISGSSSLRVPWQS